MSWKKYYEKSKPEPRPSLVSALKHFKTTPKGKRLAIDLGCGNGGDTIELLKHGWRVIAADSSPDAFVFLKKNLSKELLPNVIFNETPMEEIEWVMVDLINASFSLPFVQKEKFKEVWKNISSSLKPNGIFAGHFFGEKDDWNDLMLLSRMEVEKLFEIEFTIIELKEKEDNAESATGPVKHWHIFEVIAKKIT